VLVGRFLGVPLKMHWSLLALMAVYVAAGQGYQMALGFLAVLSHELAHVVAARVLGLDVESVELLPFGGVARLAGLDAEDAARQSLVAMAGPLSSLVLAAVAVTVPMVLPVNPDLLRFFVVVNVGLALFNLVPAGPLDGGRLWRALRSMRVGYAAARREVRRVAEVAALLLVAWCLLLAAFGVLWWQAVVLAGFLWWAARRPDEGAAWPVRDLADRRAALGKRSVWMVEDFAVRADAPLSQVLSAMRPKKMHRVAVLTPAQDLLGVVWERELLAALERDGPSAPVSSLIHRHN
jgi:stage IV sporulation protein FB